VLTELESRLADVLGSRLPAPFAGRVRRRGVPGPAGNGPVIRIGVDEIAPLESDIGAVRREVVPGSPDRRDVVRLAVRLGALVEPEAEDDRLEQLRGLDALLTDLRTPEMRSATALAQPGDPGFLLQSLSITTSKPEAGLVLVAEGWFWPVGQTGESGDAIARVRVRELRLPVALEVGGPLHAGGGAVSLRLTLGATGTLDVGAEGTTTMPFGSVALRLRDAAGGPGSGVLSGGESGPEGSRLAAVTRGVADLTYEPPATPGVDHLLVALHSRDDDGDQHVGAPVARFDLVSAP
jgi:hypothetical protein